MVPWQQPLTEGTEDASEGKKTEGSTFIASRFEYTGERTALPNGKPVWEIILFPAVLLLLLLLFSGPSLESQGGKCPMGESNRVQHWPGFWNKSHL